MVVVVAGAAEGSLRQEKGKVDSRWRVMRGASLTIAAVTVTSGENPVQLPVTEPAGDLFEVTTTIDKPKCLMR